MFLKSMTMAAALAASASSFAAGGCTKSFDLGSMGPPATKSFVSGYFAATNFDDCYDFTLAKTADMTGITTEWNWNFAGLLGTIDVITASLYSTVNGVRTALVGTDASPDSLSFGNLAAGAYELVISGSTTKGLGTTIVAYSGTLDSKAAVAAPVPEPELVAMMGLGLAGAGWAARRRKQQKS